MKHLITTLLLTLATTLCQAQSAQDSILIANAKWHSETNIANGITHRSAQIVGLYGSVQSITVVEIPRSHRGYYGIAGGKGMLTTSNQATDNNAQAAINGTYYNMRAGNSVCFYKVGGEVIDSTSVSEFRSRVNGAVRTHKRKLQILKWNKNIEQGYRGKRGTVLASGPLLLEGGRTSDWSACDEGFILSRHPRSAVLLTRRGDVLFLTVDGRSKGNADGMSIPELTFLARQLGAVEGINLDGGGSTTLWMRGAGVVNYPSDNRRYDHAGERKVSNIIYVR